MYNEKYKCCLRIERGRLLGIGWGNSMGILYEQVLDRLREYRGNRSMTQREVAQMLGISQSQYSKMESGNAQIPYRVLLCMYKEGWDLDYLVTGEVFEGEGGRFVDVRGRFSGMERSVAYQLILWAVDVFLIVDGREQSEEIRLMKILLYHEDRTSVLRVVRESLDMSQVIMAESVGIGLRKYRQLERESKQPDFKVLCQVCELGRAVPTLFFDWEAGKSLLVERLWGEFSEERQRKLWMLLESGRRLARILTT